MTTSFRYGPYADVLVSSLPQFDMAEFEQLFYGRVDTNDNNAVIQLAEPQVAAFTEWNVEDDSNQITEDQYNGVVSDLAAIASLYDMGILNAQLCEEYTKTVLAANNQAEDTKEVAHIQSQMEVEDMSLSLASAISETRTTEFDRGMEDSINSKLATPDAAKSAKAYNMGYASGTEKLNVEKTRLDGCTSFEQLATKVGYTVEDPKSIVDKLATDLLIEADAVVKHVIKYTPVLKNILTDTILFKSVITDLATAMKLTGVTIDLTDDTNLRHILAHMAVWVNENADAKQRAQKMQDVMIEKLSDMSERVKRFDELVVEGVAKQMDGYKKEVSRHLLEATVAKDHAAKFTCASEYILAIKTKDGWSYIGVTDKEHMPAALTNSLKSTFYARTKFASKAIKFASAIEAIDARERLMRKKEKLDFEGIEHAVIVQPAVFICDGVTNAPVVAEDEDED